MAQPSYIPSKDSLLASWAENFRDLILLSPTTYGLTSTDADAIDDAVTPFLAAYTVAVNPATRTKPSVAAKDSAKAAMLAVVRPYAQQIANNAGVDPNDKLDLGLTVRTGTRSPIFVPQTQPLLQIVAATPLAHTLRMSDSNSPQLRGKPFGAKACYCVVGYGPTMIVDPDLCAPAVITNAALAVPSEAGLATRQPFSAQHETGDVGKLATFFARWVGIRGDVGPWSLPAAMTVANVQTGS